MSRRARLSAALVVIAVAGLISACGSSAPGGAGGRSIAAGAKQSERFAKCMRKNGVGQFPDPPASGGFTIDAIANGSSLNTNTPAFAEALKACRGLEPAGFTGSKRSSRQQSAALRFAACMRKNGVPDFPDPTPNGPLIDTNLIPSANRPGGMSALNAAKDRCSSLAAVVIGRRA